ncbi:MAG: hypothetical protein HQM12_08450 [SAR324 cluster bacterium]|nr:hypothetical protein [SAR324 cluster bacterium]
MWVLTVLLGIVLVLGAGIYQYLRTVDSELKNTQSELRRLKKLLELDENAQPQGSGGLRPRIAIELKNPVALAERHHGMAKYLAEVAPQVLTAKVYARFQEILIQELEKRDIDVQVETILY